ncbi:hypothetical protein, partial [Lactobacillus helveticus]|uniref:hypothetical protein n=1 Tax=Lactobacillus helveticus TaxID=1587 RepID=UPI001F3F4111
LYRGWGSLSKPFYIEVTEPIKTVLYRGWGSLSKPFYIEVTEPIKTVFLQLYCLAGAINQLFLWRIYELV